MMDFFDSPPPEPEYPAIPAGAQPLAERMRPHSFEEWLGQDEAAGPASFLRRSLERGSIPSLIFWGPPGCGKTTLAHLIARNAGMAFQPLSAVTSGVKDVKTVIETARARLGAGGLKTLLFIDEIHRFNKAQQDAFLPHVESGVIVLIGATTENPSFSVIAPLLSRCRVITLQPLDQDALVSLLTRALGNAERGLGHLNIMPGKGVLEKIAAVSDGDARRALNLLEQCAVLVRDANGEENEDEELEPAELTPDLVADAVRRDHMLYDKGGEEHFNLISAFHKSMRASQPSAALYWMARMLAAGEDPLFIARRIVACASEDVGLADPQALPQSIAALQAIQFLGMPEAELAMAQATIYVATAPKSNQSYKAKEAAKRLVKVYGSLPVPSHLRNAPARLMKYMGYHRDYQYDHDCPDRFSGQPCFPEDLDERTLYEPGAFGFEKELRKRLDWWAELRVREER